MIIFRSLRSFRHIAGAGVGWLALLASLHGQTPGAVDADGTAFLGAWFHAQPRDRDLLARREVMVRELPATGREIAVLAACQVAVSPATFTARLQAAGDMMRRTVPAGVLGDSPTLNDLAKLSLDQGDLDRVRRCRHGECALNLSAAEISAMQRALHEGGATSSEPAQQAFRRIVLDRARLYREAGLSALPDYHDRREAVTPASVFSSIVQRSPYLAAFVPDVVDRLQRSPRDNMDGAASRLRWSRLTINHKAVVTVVHVMTLRPDRGRFVPAVVVVSKQVYASRYMNGSLGLTMLFGEGERAPHYLVHVERSDLDELQGLFGGVKRTIIEGRLKAEAAEALVALRNLLERGV